MFFPRDETSVEPNKSARWYGGGNKQCRGIPSGLPNTYPYEYRRENKKIRTKLSTFIGQW